MAHQIAIEKLIVLEKNKLFFNNNTFTLHTLQHFADVLKGLHILKLLKEGALKKTCSSFLTSTTEPEVLGLVGNTLKD